MKKLIFISFLLFTSSISIAQLKIGYIDSDAIMDSLPDVLHSRQKLNTLIQEWRVNCNTAISLKGNV